MTTAGETTGSARDARALRRASLSPTAMTPTQSKRQRTAAEMTLDTGNGGRARLAAASVRVASGNAPQHRQSNTGSSPAIRHRHGSNRFGRHWLGTATVNIATINTTATSTA
ncbi:hypothetical protein PR002_g15561 [Phytophthora rubi]|uniref:Uncharacterized protein n=1 Tax=Phytophthora rubi TaxID=129364 RepID=A0A6A3KRI5_9STRA|nr:hypothetical protein PR002_g15561 [Phytophthora rubi]